MVNGSALPQPLGVSEDRASSVRLPWLINYGSLYPHQVPFLPL